MIRFADLRYPLGRVPVAEMATMTREKSAPSQWSVEGESLADMAEPNFCGKLEPA